MKVGETISSTFNKDHTIVNTNEASSYLSRLLIYLSKTRKWSRWPEELVSESKRLWTVMISARAMQAGAIRAKASGPTVFLSSNWSP